MCFPILLDEWLIRVPLEVQPLVLSIYFVPEPNYLSSKQEAFIYHPKGSSIVFEMLVDFMEWIKNICGKIQLPLFPYNTGWSSTQ